MDVVTPKVVLLPLDKIISCEIQPPNRVKQITECSELVQLIKSTSIIEPIRVVKIAGGKYECSDGHRRMAACYILGIANIPAIVDESGMSATELFIALNGTRRGITHGQMFVAWANCENKREFMGVLSKASNNMSRNICSMVELFGAKRAAEVAKSGHLPTLHLLSKRIDFRISETVGRANGAARPKRRPTNMQIGEWLVHHKNSGSMAIWCKTDAAKTKSVFRLIGRILENKPFPPTEWA